MSKNFKEESLTTKKSISGSGSFVNYTGNRNALREISNCNRCGVPSRSDNHKKAIDKRKTFWEVHNDKSHEISQIEIKSISTKTKSKIICKTTCIVNNSETLVNKRSIRRKTIDTKYKDTRSSIISNQVDELRSKIRQCSLNENNIVQGTSERNEALDSNKLDMVKDKRNRYKEVDQNYIEDPYKKYEDNLFLCTTYVKDIYNYLLNLEDSFINKSDFMRGMNITPRIRAVLVDWMIDVQLLFKLSNESLHLSVYLVDCYLSNHRNTKKEELQVIAMGCIVVAGKYDLVHPPHLEDLLRATEYTIRRSDVLKMEVEVLKTINFRLNKPHIVCFLRRYGIISDIDKVHHCCSKFFVDACLLNYSISQQKSSLIAAAATFLSLSIKFGSVKSSLWNSNLTKYSKYDFNDFLPILRILSPFVIDLPSKYYSTAIMEKYSMSQFENVKDKIYNPVSLDILKKIGINVRNSQTYIQRSSKNFIR